MKPHLWKRRGLWRCATQGMRVGLGYTAREAYDDWQSQA